MISEVETALRKRRYAGRGDDVIITASLPMRSPDKTNFLKVHRI